MLEKSVSNKTPLSAVLILLALSPFTLAAKGCNTATVGEDGCAAGEACAEPGTAGSGEDCGGLTGLACGDGEYCDYAPSAMCGAADATGVCKPMPEACGLIYAPVCGCDGKTYGNACAAQQAGVSAASEGECAATGGSACGGLTGEGCAAGEFCSYAPEAVCGAADATGVCQPIPDTCTTIDDPVCGCDDVTYSNACEANAAGVSVASFDACDSEPGGGGDDCGGLQGSSCADGEFCKYSVDDICGAADATGVCTPLPQACDTLYDPVCGCDGMTYGNDCEAHAAGTSVAKSGECDDSEPGTVCGGLLGEGCPADQYCNYPLEAQCGAGDMTGTCEVIPGGCTLEYEPVCGCDDKTYSNACAAASAGVSVAATGECP